MNPHRELIVSCTLRGGARRLSRGAEGVTGCSGEGLHPLCLGSSDFVLCAFSRWHKTNAGGTYGSFPELQDAFHLQFNVFAYS